MDVLFISPGAGSNIYQGLSRDYSAVETPTWLLLLAESCRSVGASVGVIDVAAEKLSNQDVINRVEKINTKLIVFVVYGQNVNAGTANMSGAIELSSGMKKSGILQPIVFIGSHVQALPFDTLYNEKSIDILCTNEGVYALRNLLKLENFNTKTLEKIKGIGFRDAGKVIITDPEKIVPQDKMTVDLPGYAWDLLPYKDTPLDLYRSPMWHAEYDFKKRTPYAAIQTSLGCQFKCEFCMINMINRSDNNRVGVASDYSGMRYWPTDFIINEFKKLIKMGVRTIRIVDEMFLLNPKHYVPLCTELAKLNVKDELKMWAYSRVDTVRRPDILNLVRKAGVKWLALGIESSNKKIRIESSKGKFDDVDIRNVIEQVHNEDIGVMANYIFGLPGDDIDSMNETLELSMDLCTIGWNAYPAMALPGTLLYKQAIQNKQKLPDDFQGYSFHSYHTYPLSTEYLTSQEILKFRDDSFIKYHESQCFLDKISSKYGDTAVKNIQNMTKIKLKRKILGD